MRVELRAALETIRGSLWMLPTLAGAIALGVVLMLLQLPANPGPAWTWLWIGDVPAASALLQTVATSIMTATTLAFSITVVALQMASQQFSPRLLRDFARDPLTQASLAVLISTFVIAIATLRELDESQPVPVFAVAFVFVMGIVSAIALLAFLGHLVRSLRVETMMLRAHEADKGLLHRDRAEIKDLARRVQRVLAGDLDRAYRDRAGETRSV